MKRFLITFIVLFLISDAVLPLWWSVAAIVPITFVSLILARWKVRR